MGIFKAAAIQMRSGKEPKRNAVDFEALVREAAGKGATYVQTPEMTGAIVRDKEARALAFKPEERDEIVAAARRLSAELGIFLHVGSTAILRADGKLANRALLFAPDGALAARYDKIHMFDVDLDNGESWRESAAYEAGGEAVVVDIGVGEARRRHLLRSALPAAVPCRGAGRRRSADRARRLHPPDRAGALACAAARPRHRERRLRHRRGAGGLHEDGRETFGHSLIVDPWGRVLAEAGHDEPGVIVAEIDTALSPRRARRSPT